MKTEEMKAKISQIKNAKHAVRNAATRRMGATIVASVRKLKLELRDLRNGKRRK